MPSTVRAGIEVWFRRESMNVGVVLRDEEAKTLLINTIGTDLIRFCNLLSTAGNMNSERIFAITKEFFKQPNAFHLSMSELKYFFSQATQFKYGKIYHGFGIDVLIQWFDVYWGEREKEIENFQLENHIWFTSHEKRTRDKGFPFGNNEPQSLKTILTEKDWERSGE